MVDELRLQNLAKAIAPQGVVGICVPDWNNKATWQIWYEGQPAVSALTDAKVGSIIQSYDITPPVPDSIDSWDILSLKICFNHENRIRSLEGKAPMTLAQFKAIVRAL